MRSTARSVKSFVGFLVAAALVLSPSLVEGQGTTTRVMIRATSHDAKIIGTGVGGARISVFNALTGTLLARGMQEGGTGSTPNIVGEPRVRGHSVFDTEGAAGFLAELELNEPTQVRIEAEGPLGTPHAAQRVTRTMLLVPGQHVLGDGSDPRDVRLHGRVARPPWGSDRCLWNRTLGACARHHALRLSDGTRGPLGLERLHDRGQDRPGREGSREGSSRILGRS